MTRLNGRAMKEYMKKHTTKHIKKYIEKYVQKKFRKDVASGLQMWHMLVLFTILFALLVASNEYLFDRLSPGETSAAGREPYTYHIAMIGGERDESFWTAVYEQAVEIGDDRGLLLESFDQESTGEYSEAELVRMARAANVDGMIVNTADDKAVEEEVACTVQAGIPVMTMWNDAEHSGRFSFAGGNSYAMGQMYGDQLVNHLEQWMDGEERKLRAAILWRGDGTSDKPNLIFAGISDRIKPQSDRIDLVNRTVSDGQNFEAEEMIRNILLDGNTPDVLICLRENDTNSAIQCVVDYNLVGKVHILGYSDNENVLDAIDKGIVTSSVVVNPASLASEAVESMQSYLEQGFANEYISVSPELIRKENVEGYREKHE